MLNGLVTERLETLLLARLSTRASPPTVDALASESQRYAPTGVGAAPWHACVADGLRGLEDRGIIDAGRQVLRADELKRRTGAHAVKRWQPWSDRILPGLALGVRADDAKAHKRLADRDAWSAAIVARAYGVWTQGPPPSAAGLCDALIWRALSLPTAPKRCPPELRAHYLRTYIAIDPGAPEPMLRQLATKLIGAPRVELKAFYPALIRGWITGSEPGARPAAQDPSSADAGGEGKARRADEPSLIDAVRSATQKARDGVFGDRKVFISSVWNALRVTPPWSELALDDFKAHLVAAHRKRELVLARADLVAAMDPALVASSETRTEGATFHFIVREPAP